ncbi:uncharacterized ABC transporter ATP-binding protein C825.01-like [Impatiens glandulifera]|uniref:uncharacterized ABC transporter ATP-binding protein C825.01-like n=1 Tax=Impatiens glandulifera TaxID=253017 RepID=UPI001FB13CFD|nr:uncharacterized ABC transporter ATP-binding protein C825.01-like [Impatiens glandulifera]
MALFMKKIYKFMKKRHFKEGNSKPKRDVKKKDEKKNKKELKSLMEAENKAKWADSDLYDSSSNVSDDEEVKQESNLEDPNEENYVVWKARVHAHLAAIDDDMWFIITNGPIKIEKARFEWTSDDKRKNNLDNVAKDILYKTLDHSMAAAKKISSDAMALFMKKIYKFMKKRHFKEGNSKPKRDVKKKDEKKNKKELKSLMEAENKAKWADSDSDDSSSNVSDDEEVKKESNMEEPNDIWTAD